MTRAKENAVFPKTVFRKTKVEDAAAIYRIARDSKVLDVNSPYCYLLLCRQFSDTCLVAEIDGEVVGFVTAWRPPSEPRTIFVWQIGVDAAARGQGIAGRLLDHLADLPACEGASELTATVTPTNKASRALFTAFARRRGADCGVSKYFEPEVFPGDEEHEPEKLYWISPIHSPSSVSPSASSTA